MVGRHAPDRACRVQRSLPGNIRGHVVVAWLWLDQAMIATRGLAGSCSNFYRGKLTACRYFFRWELPRIDRWLALLDPVERTPLDAPEHCFL
jgi:hypothetical protein